MRRLLESWLKERRAAGVAAPGRNHSLSGGRVEQLPGFNKLVKGRHGVYVANENDAFIGRALITYGEYCELEWSLLERYCEPGSTVVEVGANIGSHTISFGKAVGESGKVIAVEPQPLIFQALCANLALNCLTNVEAVNCGCGKQRQTRYLPRIDYAEEGNFGGVELQPGAAPVSSIPVEVRKLDDLLAACKAVNLIKIDVEGMEAQVIEGGRKSIKSFRPVLYVENDRPAQSQALEGLLLELGYRLWWHIPPLFNPDNYFANANNLYPHVSSFNMLCLHGGAVPGIEGLAEITDSSQHPLAQRPRLLP
jgi:FkbM family methyltransferase